MTDIPDWCAVEALGLAGSGGPDAAPYDFDGPFGPAALTSVAALAAMWDKSPAKLLNQVRGRRSFKRLREAIVGARFVRGRTPLESRFRFVVVVVVVENE